MSQIQFSVENYPQVEVEMQAIFPKHWEEIALFRDKIPLSPDYPRYHLLFNSGKLLVCTVRDRGELVGYYIVIIDWHLHYTTSLTGLTDVYFIRPTHRKGALALSFFRFVEETLKLLGVEVFYTSTKLNHDVSRVWNRLGYDAVETKFVKWLGGASNE
jgi:hypothetical protein